MKEDGEGKKEEEKKEEEEGREGRRTSALGVLVHIKNSSRKLRWDSKFQTGQDYIERPCQKRKGKGKRKGEGGRKKETQEGEELIPEVT
jgi:hypothetical protein